MPVCLRFPEKMTDLGRTCKETFLIVFLILWGVFYSVATRKANDTALFLEFGFELPNYAGSEVVINELNVETPEGLRPNEFIELQMTGIYITIKAQYNIPLLLCNTR